MELARKPLGALVAVALFCTICISSPWQVDAQGNPQIPIGRTQAYHDDEMVTVNLKEMPARASASLILRNKRISQIYVSNDLGDEQDFTPVIDAVPGGRFNPLLQQILIEFNEGIEPRQFTSEAEILEAASGDEPEITLVVTTEIYRCTVVGERTK